MPFDGTLTEQQVRCYQLADFIEKSETFEMAWYFSCGSPACVAGHAACLSGQSLVSRTQVKGAAIGFLNINDAQACRMFAPTQEDGLHWNMGNITARMAAAMLRRFAQTGEIEYRWEDDQA